MASEDIPYSGSVVTRDDAKAQGLKYYFTGITCIRGHIDVRFTSNTSCKTCGRLSTRVARKGERLEKVAKAQYDGTIITIEEARGKGLRHYFTGVPCARGHVALRATSTRSCTECRLKIGRAWRKGEPVGRPGLRKYAPYDGEIVTREEAKAKGLRRYFTGEPCPRGHIDLRTTLSGACTECTRLHGRAISKGEHLGRIATNHIIYDGPIVTREEAKARSLRHYFPKTTCVRGHVCKRLTSTGSCVECSRLYAQGARSGSPLGHARIYRDTETTKECRKCGVEKPIGAFQKRTGTNGTVAHCKSCVAIRSAENHKLKSSILFNRPKTCKRCGVEKLATEFREYNSGRLWRSPHCCSCEVILAAEAKARIEASQQKWLGANPNYRREYGRRWYAANPERAKAKLYRWRAKHPEVFREIGRRYQKNNPERVRSTQHTARARRRGAEGFHTAEDIARIRTFQKDRCAHPWCKRKLRGKGHRDHKVSLACGGSNWPENIQLLCGPCNLKKGAKDPFKHAHENGYLL